MIWFIAYLLTIPAANWLISTVGVVPVGFGLMAPAGVYCAGLAFTFRDLTHDALGRWWTLAAIGAGALLSLVVSDPFVAAASALAFTVSELADFAVYTPFRERGWLRVVAMSNLVGLVVDSVLFLGVAFGSLAFLPGLVLAKVWMTLLAVGVLWLVRSRRQSAGVAA